MNIFKRFFNLFGRQSRNNYSDHLFDGFFSPYGSYTESGESVSVRNATGISTVFSCINVLAQDVAKLPFNVRRDTSDATNNVQIIRNNPVFKLIHTRPNEHTSAYNFWYKLVWDMLSHGNGYAIILRSGGQPKELIALNPQEVKITVVDNRAYYEVDKVGIFSQDDILHIKIYSFDGITGVSPIIYNAESFGYRLKVDKYKSKVTGTKPPGVLSTDRDLTDTQYEQAVQWWKRLSKPGETPVAAGGFKYQPTMIPPQEGQMIEALKLNREDICGIYRMPPAMIQDYERATFSNAEQQDLVYLKYSLTPLLKVIEQECDFKLFNKRSDLYTKFNVKAMLRGDIKTQAEWYRMLRTQGLASADEIRAMEDLPALEDGTGKIVLIQGAMMPLSKVEEFYSSSDNTDEAQRQLGFTLQQLKEGVERLEIMNHE